MSSSAVRDMHQMVAVDGQQHAGETAQQPPRRTVRWATRASSSTDSVPVSAGANRQPKALSVPNSHMPAAIIHLPSGGWTT